MKNLIKYGFIAVVMLSFIGCRAKIETQDWKNGKDFCKDKEGVRYISNGFLGIGCKCNNGDYKMLNY